jgi:uncharacterized protein YggE
MRRLVLAGMLFPSAILSQESDIRTPLPPQLVVSAHAETKITPDRARVHVAVLTRAPNAAAAASENAQIQQRVFSALRALGIRDEHLSTTGYNVEPEYRHERDREPRIVGYRVTNTIVVEVQRVDLVGRVLDAALGAGANSISGLQFYASNTEAARRQALANAIEIARQDAEVMARAAGGTLGSLLEASVGAFIRPPPRPMMRVESLAATGGVVDTPISPGTQTVSVDVTTRWRFLTAR